VAVLRQGIEQHLLLRSNPSNYLYVAERHNGNIDHKMDHLVCFYPGEAWGFLQTQSGRG
jgi:hypothetical protein